MTLRKISFITHNAFDSCALWDPCYTSPLYFLLQIIEEKLSRNSNNRDPQKRVNDLMSGLFRREEMAGMSLTGKPKTPGHPAKPGMDPDLVQAIIGKSQHVHLH